MFSRAAMCGGIRWLRVEEPGERSGSRSRSGGSAPARPGGAWRSSATFSRPGVLDRREQPPDDRRDDEVQDREEGRAHVGRDLAEHLLGLGARGLGRTPRCSARAARSPPRTAGMREHDLLHAVRAAAASAPRRRFSSRYRKIRIERRTLRATASLALARAARATKRAQVDRLAHLDGEVAVGDEEARSPWRDPTAASARRRRGSGSAARRAAPCARRARAAPGRSGGPSLRAVRPPRRAGRARCALRDRLLARPRSSERSRAVRRNRKKRLPAARQLAHAAAIAAPARRLGGAPRARASSAQRLAAAAGSTRSGSRWRSSRGAAPRAGTAR